MYQVYTHVTIKSWKQLKVSKIPILLMVKHIVTSDDFSYRGFHFFITLNLEWLSFTLSQVSLKKYRKEKFKIISYSDT